MIRWLIIFVMLSGSSYAKEEPESMQATATVTVTVDNSAVMCDTQTCTATDGSTLQEQVLPDGSIVYAY